MARPKKYTISLTEEERSKLNSVIKKKTTSKTMIRRCRIMLELDINSSSNLTHEQLANSYGVCKATIANIILDYVQNGIDSVVKNKRNPNSNAKLKADGRVEAKLIQIACGPAPDGRSRWTLRLLEEKARLELETPISRETIRRTLKKTNSDLT
jgi:transposase